MKRESLQHGMVRTFPTPWNRSPDSKPNSFDSPPTAGLFTKVSPKPTSHSKFTDKWECHTHPTSKSKGKAKGAQKLRSCDVVSNSRLLTCRVVDANKPGLKFAGSSGSGILDHLASDYSYMDDYDYDYYYDCVGEVHAASCDGAAHLHSVGFEIASGAVEIRVDEENEDASFYDVALVWDRADEDEDEDEDWCLVAQM